MRRLVEMEGDVEKISRIYKYLLYVLSLALCFSYYPLIKLGENETMYFELSLSLIWLVVFDILVFVMVYQKYRTELFTHILGDLKWWAFPLFVTASALWSLNTLRAVLTVGVVWVLFFAVLGMVELRELLDARFWKVFWRWFFGAALLACVWCVVQCILDVNGVSQEAALLCDGCVSQMFGFPHPNGWAIEPQFMGNLLLAPVLTSLYFYLEKSKKKYLLLFFVLSAGLFLTFSRGAIYAGVTGLVFMWGFVLARGRNASVRGKNVKAGKVKGAEAKVARISSIDYRQKIGQILKSLGVFAGAFVVVLCLQGVMAANSPTSDTYGDGVAKVINHLTLGLVDIRGGGSSAGANSDGAVENSENNRGEVEVENAEVVENSKNGSSLDDDSDEVSQGAQEAIYDGYVAESTDTRVRLAGAAITVWWQDFKTVMMGVGIGGAGQALYNNGLSPAPREIVQNEYASLLLETGVIGVSLFVLLVVMAVRAAVKSKVSGLILALMVAYGVTLCFFSGVTNALQVVLVPGLLILMDNFAKKSSRKIVNTSK